MGITHAAYYFLSPHSLLLFLQPSWNKKNNINNNSHATSRARPECAAIARDNYKENYTTPQIGCDEEAFVSRRATNLSALRKEYSNTDSLEY